MPTAHAAEMVATTSSHQLTISAIVMIGVMLAMTMGFAFWSWRRRRDLASRRREAASALRASEDRLRQVTDQLPLAIFEFLPAGPRFASISEGVARLLPRSAAEILDNADRFFSALHPEDVGGLAWRTAGGPPAADFEWIGRSQVPGAPPRWLQIRATTGITVDGQPAIHGAILDVTALKEAQQELEGSRAELRLLASHRETRVEQERARLAREFHDELGQVLTTARMQLQLLDKQAAADAPALRNAVQAVEGMIGDAQRSVKEIASDLRPAALNLGLAAAIEWIAGRTLGAAGIPCRISVAPAADKLDDARAIALFRIVQESLSNILRHAGAAGVHITLSHQDGELHLLIEDDGLGFDARAVDHRSHFGLLGISERVTALGGSLEIDSSPGAGTRLSVSIPDPATGPA